MHLQESGEMYLETIYILTKKNHDVRSLDVAEYMNFSKPSVSRAVGILKQGGYTFNAVLMVGEGGFGPPKLKSNRFTVCPLWPLGNSPIWSW